MDAKKQIKSSIQEAELYKSQGLFDEAKEKYLSIVEFIQKNEKIQKKQNLINSISKKISALEKEIEKIEIETAPIASEMSQKIQSFIKIILREAETYASQGLVAPAKEKYSQAAEFLKKDDQVKNKKKLLDGISKKISALEKEIEKIETAQISSEMPQKIQSFIKIILREAETYASQGLVAPAKEKYSQAAEFLKKDDQLKNKKKLLDGISKKISALEKKAKPKEEKKKPTPPEVPVKDEEAEVPTKDEEALEEEKKEEIEEEIQEFIDISSIGIALDHGPEKGRVVELDVSFQSGNLINLIISSKDKTMIENFKAGDKLNGIQFYSPIAIFKGSGIVSANTQIDSGPRQGDYRLEIKILST